jgi:hypothetical protein
MELNTKKDIIAFPLWNLPFYLYYNSLLFLFCVQYPGLRPLSRKRAHYDCSLIFPPILALPLTEVRIGMRRQLGILAAITEIQKIHNTVKIITKL